jgi:hypothetical protein
MLNRGVDRPQGRYKAILLEGRRVDDRCPLRSGVYNNEPNPTGNRDHGQSDEL